MKKLSEKGRKALRMIFRGLGVTAVSLIFQACYGPPPDMGNDVVIHGSVKSKTTNAPIQGINVSIEGTDIQYPTSSSGYFSIYLPRQNTYTVNFEDVDGSGNGGLFKSHSKTVDTYPGESDLNVQVVELEEVDAE